MKLLTFLITSILLVGCSGVQEKPLPPPPVVDTQFITVDCGNPPKRSKVEFRPIFWNWMKDADGDTVYYLTPKGYEDLSFNTSELIKGAKELKAALAYYMDCIKAPDNERK